MDSVCVSNPPHDIFGIFCSLQTDGPSIAIDGSFIGRKFNRLLLFCFFPTDGSFLEIQHVDCASLTCPYRARVDLIKREFPREIAIKRESPTIFGDVDDIAIDVDVDVDVDANVDVDIGDAGAKSGGEHVDDVGGIYGGFTPFSGHTTSFAPSSRSCSACKCKECKNKNAQLISMGEDVKKSFNALTSVVKELISKRCFSCGKYFYILNTYFFLLEMIPRLLFVRLLLDLLGSTHGGVKKSYAQSLSQQVRHKLQQVGHPLQQMTHLLDTCPK
ncbi:hypothetical protein H5410_003674 [Solanum commersonii]|uniref:Uncharacterized protein n=1 Tax=Solanum commersonii TaxID=4109 RepID=A0A9J6B5B0_SOLCO|nr:hypothetical protein H5410_003674 [Solanum commersonii]